MGHFFSHKNENENTTVNNTPEAVMLNDEELEAVTGGYMIAGPEGQLDWWKRQLYYKQHPGTMQPLTTTVRQ